MRKYFYRGESLSLVLQTPVPQSGERVKLTDYTLSAKIQGVDPSIEVLNDYEVRLFLNSQATSRLETGKADLILSLQAEDLVIIGKNIDLFAVDPVESRPIDGMNTDQSIVVNINSGDIVLSMSLEHVSRSSLRVWQDNGNPDGTEEEFLAWLQEPAKQAGEAAILNANLAENKAEIANSAAVSANAAALVAQQKATEAGSAAVQATQAKEEAESATIEVREEIVKTDALIVEMEALSKSLSDLALELNQAGSNATDSGIYAAQKAALAVNAATEALARANDAQLQAELSAAERQALAQMKTTVELATQAAIEAKNNANQSSLLAQQKAELAKINAELAKSEALKAATASLTANNAAIRAESSADDADDAAILANEAAITANNASDALLSNVISLEIRDDMHLYMTTPDVYSGFMFKIENGSLIAII